MPEEPPESASVYVVRVDDFGPRRYRVNITITVHATTLAEAVEIAGELIGGTP